MKSKFNAEFFSANLKKLIKDNKIKNVDLATHLGLSKSAISNYISGVSVPKLEISAKIAEYFDVELEKLMGENIEETEIGFDEGENVGYKIPIFSKKLASDSIIYRKENYIGVITSPLPASESSDCYAVKVYNDSMSRYGFNRGSLVFFSPSEEVLNGDVAAVLIKSKKQIIIRLVEFENKKIILKSDNSKEEFKSTKDCDAQVLGKVIFATFYPNK